MMKPRLIKELYRRGLVPGQFERILKAGFTTGADVTAFRELLGMRIERFANALGIPVELLQSMEASTEPPSPKFVRRLEKAATDPGAFFEMK
jgi:DNA-binding transcriptional regulator YiaG